MDNSLDKKSSKEAISFQESIKNSLKFCRTHVKEAWTAGDQCIALFPDEFSFRMFGRSEKSFAESFEEKMSATMSPEFLLIPESGLNHDAHDAAQEHRLLHEQHLPTIQAESGDDLCISSMMGH